MINGDRYIPTRTHSTMYFYVNFLFYNLQVENIFSNHFYATIDYNKYNVISYNLLFQFNLENFLEKLIIIAELRIFSHGFYRKLYYNRGCQIDKRYKKR